MAKALTGGLPIVMTATPSAPTSKSTLGNAISERNKSQVPSFSNQVIFFSHETEKTQDGFKKDKAKDCNGKWQSIQFRGVFPH